MRYIVKFFFLLMVLGSGLGIYHTSRDFFALRLNGVYAPAQVLSFSSSRMVGVQGGTSYISSRTVSYVTADGTLLTHDFKSQFSKSKVGDTVGVFYNPGNPAEVIPDTWNGLFISALLGALALTALGAMLVI